MAGENLEIERALARSYDAGFVTDIESDTLPPGLDEGVVRWISARKGEPGWLLEWRLQAYRHWLTMPMPDWAKLEIAPIDLQAIRYFAAPKKQYASLDEVDPKLLETYEKLGVPLHERARLYLTICQRQATQREAAPQTIDERLYAATLSINGGQYDQAIVHLRLVRDEDPDNDHAIYMLAVAHAQRDEHAEAVAHLERAIALNPENRALARNDSDLEPLRDDDAFRAALEAPAGSRPVARRPIKTRSAR